MSLDDIYNYKCGYCGKVLDNQYTPVTPQPTKKISRLVKVHGNCCIGNLFSTDKPNDVYLVIVHYDDNYCKVLYATESLVSCVDVIAAHKVENENNTRIEAYEILGYRINTTEQIYNFIHKMKEK